MNDDKIISDLQVLLEDGLNLGAENTRINQNEISDSINVTLLDNEEKSENEFREPSLVLSDYTKIEEEKYNIDKSVEEFKKQYPEVFRRLEEIENKRKELEDKQEELKNEMTKSLEAADLKNISNSKFSVTYVAETQRTNFDRKTFEKKYPELCKQFITVSTVSAYTKWTRVK